MFMIARVQKSWPLRFTAAVMGVCSLFASLPASALDLDWSGQFRAEAHWINNYTLSGSNILSDARNGAGGYYIPGGGDSSAHFQPLFLRLRPKVIVNDNVYIKSEWWLGDPIYGMFGNAVPYPADQRQYYSSQSRGSAITAQRFWGEFLSDIGTIQVGRAPLHWGLGIVWDNGDDIWDRYQSTGDVIRLVSKFGAFSFTPAIIKYSLGNSIGGSCNASTTVAVTGSTGIPVSTCNPTAGGGGLTDYSLQLKYENLDEDFELGVNFIKRIAGGAQDQDAGYLGLGTETLGQQGSGMNFNTWDIYGKKKWGRFWLAGELPITTGNISTLEYKTFAVALEGGWKPSDTFETSVKAGRAPGQPNGSSSSYRAFYYNPNYRLGMIMFNYQFANFVGPNSQNDPTTPASSLRSPYDNPVVNAKYISTNFQLQANKWKFHSTWTFASANETAVAGDRFFNTWERRFRTNTSGVNQGSFLGWEMDYGTTYQWDDTFQFGLEFGFFFPGSFFEFSNTPTLNATSMVFASAFRVGVAF